jgi:hypothetical protein
MINENPNGPSFIYLVIIAETNDRVEGRKRKGHFVGHHHPIFIWNNTIFILPSLGITPSGTSNFHFGQMFFKNTATASCNMNVQFPSTQPVDHTVDQRHMESMEQVWYRSE